MIEYLSATRFINSDHPSIIKFANESLIQATDSDTEKVIQLYMAVRDLIPYDPYRIDLTEQGMRASTTIENGYGWCVPKSLLLTAMCRAIGIPARMGFADVRNHLSTRRLTEFLGTDIYYWHSYTSIFLNDKWVKATPAFDKTLCEKANIQPLDFNGEEDSIFHPYDKTGNLHMEYVNYRGEYPDLPYSEIVSCYHEHYPNMSNLQKLNKRSFLVDVGNEKEN